MQFLAVEKADIFGESFGGTVAVVLPLRARVGPPHRTLRISARELPGVNEMACP
jgi:pimeloyl-ACP methyl ester carboxylesterase